MKKLILILISFVIFVSCRNSVEHETEPVVINISESQIQMKKYKYYIIVKLGRRTEGFWTNKEYHIGDTLNKCK